MSDPTIINAKVKISNGMLDITGIDISMAGVSSSAGTKTETLASIKDFTRGVQIGDENIFLTMSVYRYKDVSQMPTGARKPKASGGVTKADLGKMTKAELIEAIASMAA